MSKELIEQLAKEHLRIGNVYECRGVIEFEESDYGNYIELSYERLEAFAKAYAQTQGQSNWISVADSLPLVGASVLTMPNYRVLPFGNDGSDDDDAPVDEFWTFNDFMKSTEIVTNVTHWMPLPAAPIESGVKG